MYSVFVLCRETVPSGDFDVWFRFGSLGRSDRPGPGHITSGLDAQLHRGTIASPVTTEERRSGRQRKETRQECHRTRPFTTRLLTLRAAVSVDASGQNADTFGAGLLHFAAHQIHLGTVFGRRRRSLLQAENERLPRPNGQVLV